MTDSDGGFSFGREWGWAYVASDQLLTLDKLEDRSCLVLLGGPGMGKSTAVQEEVTRLKSSVRTSGDAVRAIDLRSYSSEDRLIRDLFDSSVVTNWLAGSHRLHLLLDSLDECLLQISTVAEMLLAELRSRTFPLTRLRLLIACRTAEWPSNLEIGLREIWENNEPSVFELAPLTEHDIRLAAKAYDIDETAFFAELDRAAVVLLARRPVTLHFLMRTFKQHQRLPLTQSELYDMGCQLMCEETSMSRRGARAIGTLPAKQRLMVAGRIAAVMIFCNRSVIRTGVLEPIDTGTEIDLRRLAGGVEPVGNGEYLDVDEDAIREVLGTTLFTSRGSERLGFAHQTYAEYLAARYVTARAFTLPQSLSLVTHPAIPNHIVPQLHETAAWLASMSPAIQEAILIGDPQVLLRSDVASSTDEVRARMVDGLLDLFSKMSLLDDDLVLRLSCGKLNHGTLHQQLDPVIRDRSQNFLVRRFAIDLAEACHIQSLQSALAEVALDTTDHHHVRSQAAHAINEIADNPTRQLLRPLAEGRSGDDEDDELKGCGLEAVWPKYLSAEEAFSLLTPQKRENFHGSYARFLNRLLLSSLDVVDLPIALNWVASRPARSEPFDALGRLADDILVAAWDHIDKPGILPAFAVGIRRRLSEYVGVTRSTPTSKVMPLWSQDDPVRRQQLAVAILQQITANAEWQPESLVYGPTPLLFTVDIPWMIERLRAVETVTLRQVWSRLIRLTFPVHSPEPHIVELLHSACSEIFELDAELGNLFRPVELCSEAAEKTRNSYRESLRWRQAEPPLLEPPPRERVERLLTKCETGEPTRWWEVNRELTLEPRSTCYNNDLEADLTKLPGWTDASPACQRRIVTNGLTYLFAADPRPDRWLGKDLFHLPAAAGFRALLLLSNQAPSALDALPADIWGKWSCIILAYPIASSEETAQSRLRLITRAYSLSPDSVLQSLLAIIDDENRRGKHLYVLSQFAECRGDRIDRVLFSKVSDSALKPSCRQDLLGELLTRGSSAAREYAAALIALPLPLEGADRDNSRAAAFSLVEHTPDAGWEFVWPALQHDWQWAEQLILELAARHNRAAANISAKLSEADASNLYLWLCSRFPACEDPIESSGMHWVTDRESVAQFRDGVLAELLSRGTHESLKEVQKISEHIPEKRWAVIHAKRSMLRKTWVPPEPEHVLRLAKERTSRLIDSGDQLLELVIESLQRWEQKLQGTPPAAFGLWNESKTGKHRPKDEERMSDAVAIHLREDLRDRGVIANREVQIRRGEKPGGTGERTDIYVSASRLADDGTVDVVAVIVEAKGCWHRELKTAMQTQLRERYLKDNQCQHGVYLVGWFGCPQWDQDDPRLDRCAKSDRESIRLELEAQATALSHSGVVLKSFIVNACLR